MGLQFENIYSTFAQRMMTAYADSPRRGFLSDIFAPTYMMTVQKWNFSHNNQHPLIIL